MSSPASHLKPLERRMTLEEFFEFQERSEQKHEFHAGQVFAIDEGDALAMAGGTVQHGDVSVNLTFALRGRLRGTPCSNTASDTAIYVQAADRTVYPDAAITCGQREVLTLNHKDLAIQNPVGIFEILSESTERYNRLEKFDLYRLIPSLREYVLLQSDQMRAERFFLADDGVWQMNFFIGPEAELTLRSVDLTLPLAELYESVTLKP